MGARQEAGDGGLRWLSAGESRCNTGGGTGAGGEQEIAVTRWKDGEPNGSLDGQRVQGKHGRRSLECTWAERACTDVVATK